MEDGLENLLMELPLMGDGGEVTQCVCLNVLFPGQMSSLEMNVVQDGPPPEKKCFPAKPEDLHITNVTSPTSAQLSITWTSTSTSMSYFLLDLRVINNSAVAPVSTYTTLSTRSKVIQGLRAGTWYNVTLKSFQSNSIVQATTWTQALTVPATPQIVQANGISSTQISVGWSPQTGTDYYFLIISLGSDTINHTFSSLSCNVIGLRPTTVYSLTLFAMNSAGPSTASKKITVLTLTPPPTDITVTPISSYTIAMSWRPVDKALMYGIFIYENADVNRSPLIRKTTATSIVLDNLSPCSKFIFGLASFNWFYTVGEENRVSAETGMIDPVDGLKIDYVNNLLPATISWSPTRGATSYTASATADAAGLPVVTCSTFNMSCELTGLLCENRYTLSVVANTVSCVSPVVNTLIIDTAPCAPQNITVSYDCLINIVYLNWNPVVDAIDYTVSAFAPDGSKEHCYNHDTTCFFMNLMCGTSYDLSVYGSDGYRNGTSSVPITIHTTPCDPQDVQATPDCLENMLTVSWTESAGAFSYAAMALGSSGTIYNCTAFRTSCVITNLQCGESLSISVVASDDECSSARSISDELVNAPCTPQNVIALPDCVTNVVMVQWEFTMGAMMYIATAVGSDGVQHSCETGDLSCTLTDLSCGDVYTLSVLATNFKCNSTPSTKQQFQSVPCTPNYIRSELNCNHNKLMVTWEQGLGNLTYKAEALEEDGSTFSCLSQTNYCEITDINCGATYTVYISADNGVCPSPTNQTLPFLSVPCAPTNIIGTPDCLNGNVSVSWTPSRGLGADLYVATLESDSQHQSSCDSTLDSCAMPVSQCGFPLTIYVVAVGDYCQSLKSQEVYLDPVPCTSPQNVNVQLECGTRTAILSWTGSLGATSYISTVTGNGGETHNCTVPDISCVIPDLTCGVAYNVTVAAARDQCISAPSQTAVFHTAPCTPGNTMALADDAVGTTVLSWAASTGAKYYVASVYRPSGASYSCNTTETTCRQSGLQCGNVYSLSVTSYDSTCHSVASDAVHFETVPCTPTNLQAQINYVADLVQLSWDAAPGALYYVSFVTGPNGEVYSCNTTTPTCTFSNLPCGQTYNATVKAFSATHSSQPSVPVQLETGPCPPQNLDVQIDCVTNAVTLTWDAALGALTYLSSVTGPGGKLYSCNTTETSCSFPDLPCGTMYNATVQAVNNKTKSLPDDIFQFPTVPCVPQTVLTQVDCETNIATLSWNSAPGALNYSSTVTSADGELHTCNTTSANCTISDLTCGETYQVIVTASDALCQSAASDGALFHSVPCVSTNVSTHLDWSTNVATVSWTPTPGALSYISTLTSAGGEVYSCSSTNASCSISGMACGLHYNLTVQTLNGQCSSISAPLEEIETAPCTPRNVAAVVICGSQITKVFWDVAPGALYYSATATGVGSDLHACNTTGTTCDIINLRCGKNYSISVTAFGSSSSSPPSTAVGLQNAACIPQNVQTLIDCNTNIATITWLAAEGATRYISSLQGPDGSSTTCNTDLTTCNIDSLTCGTTYVGTVTAIDGHCDNAVSNPVQLQTAPCTPSTAQSSLNCSSDIATLVWSATPGAVNYTSFVVGSGADQHSCGTSDTTCAISDLQCGLAYAVNLKAHGPVCSSPAGPSTNLQTAPCEPQSVNVQVQCGTGIAAITWSSAPGAINYIAYVRRLDGSKVSCNTTGTTCNIEGLACGQQYSASVTAFNDLCGGTPSVDKLFRTAPCVPSDVHTQLDCATNIATVSWAQAAGAEQYEVSVTAPGEQHSCNSTTTTCDVSGLQCGITYSVAVTASNAVCTSAASTAATFQTVPCTTPEANSTIDCALIAATLTWSNTSGALRYVANVTASSGDYHTCTTTETACNIPDLLCGQEYTGTITAFGERCSGAPSYSVPIPTVPCIPQVADPVVECEHNVATVSWAPSNGALSYMSTVTGVDGQQYSCTSTGTTCSISGLLCGLAYNVSVEALNDVCSTAATVVPVLNTAPCQTQNIAVQLNCGTSVTTFSWDDAQGAVNYISNVRGPDGEEFSCNTTDTSCDIEGLACGREYHTNVTAFNDLCGGISSVTKIFRTAPCAPQNVAATIVCATNTAKVSWQPAPGADSYVSNATGPNGDTLSCTTLNTSCEISGLECGQIYNITVTAIGENCNDSPSDVILLQSAPCPTTNVETLIDCPSNTATVLWQYAAGAVNYTASLSILGVEKGSCSSVGTACDIINLQCGQVYTLTVTSFSEECRGLPSNASEFRSVPCVPTNVGSLLDCGSNDVAVFWGIAAGAQMYRASVTTDSDSKTYTCNTNISTCDIPQLDCGLAYNVTVTALDDVCRSAPSAATHLISAPCTPSLANISVDCETNTMMLVVQNTPGALSYATTVSAPDGQLYSCNSTDTVCSISNLPCGQKYNATTSALNRECSSTSTSFKFQTAPCSPFNLVPQLDCATNIAKLSWPSTAGAETYTASVTGLDGQPHSCTTVDNNCSINGLQCGQNYTAIANAATSACKGPSSYQAVFQTVPCVPVTVKTHLDTASNTATLSWSAAAGADYYRASVSGPTGEVHSCNTADVTCTVADLACGQTYQVTVTGHSEECASAASGSAQLQTVPCIPNNLNAAMDCTVNVATLSWGSAAGADRYIATLVGRDGLEHSCNTMTTRCSIGSLQCGQTYNATVSAARQDSTSPASLPVEIHTAPCIPTISNVSVDCLTNYASVRWDLTAGAQTYTAVATDGSGFTASCSTTDATCEIQHLLCGSTYTVTVTAGQPTCQALPSAPVSARTAPCAPKNIIPSLDITNTLSVTWVPSARAESYTVTAVGNNGIQEMCTSSGITCDILFLDCETIFNITVTALGGGCESPASQAVTVKTGVCKSAVINSSLACNNDSGSFWWNKRYTASSYSVTAGNDALKSCSTTELSCTIADLPCGQLLNVTWEALDASFQVLETAITKIETAPCPPTNLLADLVCSTNIATVHWNHTGDVLSFSVTANATDLFESSCSSVQTSCEMINLVCGQTYTVLVTAFGVECQTISSEAYLLDTAPCPPANVQGRVDCVTNIVTVTWDPSDRATSYQTTVKDPTGDPAGDQVVCSTANTNCEISTLQCGKKYNITITALYVDCTSSNSDSVQIETVPCAPQNVGWIDSCSSDVLIQWKGSAGAVSYKVAAQRSNGNLNECQTSGTSCNLSALPCGESFVTTVQASRDTCNSSFSPTVKFYTVPCIPQNVIGYTQCNSDVASLVWEPAAGALLYTATAVATDGNATGCYSSSTTCDVTNLRCGQTYSIAVVATNQNCSALSSSISEMKTAPCPPEGVNVQHDCNTNYAAVSWAQSAGAMNYTVTAATDSGLKSWCSDTGGSCTLVDLNCGLNYSITVKASNGDCDSLPSLGYNLETVPCKATYVHSNRQCESKAIAVYWTAGSGSDQYTVTAKIPEHTATCTSNGTSCDIQDMLCGKEYTITITGSSERCNSTASSPIYQKTIPCVPPQLAAYARYEVDSIIVSWAPTANAETYTATAAGVGPSASCTTTNTTCEIPGLLCGETYNVTLYANDGFCNGLISQALQIKTAPCIPANVQSTVVCLSNTMFVSWNLTKGATSYNVISVGTSGQVISLSTNSTNGELTGLACGESYNVTVIAVRNDYQSPASAGVQTRAVPCTPNSLHADVHCGNNTTLVTWDTVSGAAMYIATAVNKDGTAVLCNSTENHCTLSGLECGNNYSITVRTSDGACNSVESGTTYFNTEPCQPHIVAADYISETASISWQVSQGATSYTAEVEATNGHIATCITNNTSCDIPNLLCGQVYTAYVTATDEKCNVMSNDTKDIITAPCVPQNILVILIQAGFLAEVTWTPSEGALSYIVVAVGSLDVGPRSCQSGNASCQIGNLLCGNKYTFSVTAVGMKSNTTANTSFSLETAPCPPTSFQAQLNCDSNSVSASWLQSTGALFYSVVANGPDGGNITCNTTFSSCQLFGFPCGMIFNLSVTAGAGFSKSTPSNMITIQSAPCVPQEVAATIHCDVNIVSITWGASAGSAAYTAFANIDGVNTKSCNTTDTFCNIVGLDCGQVYNVTVIALYDLCPSPPSTPTELTTAPCFPYNPDAHINCDTGIIAVTWGVGRGAAWYQATAKGMDGHSSSCNTTDIQCSIGDLHCGMLYTITVVAENFQCNASTVSSAFLETAPCVPARVESKFECSTNTALVSWSESTSGASFYTVNADNGLGVMGTCNSTLSSCPITGLLCGQAYSFSVQAGNRQCNAALAFANDTRSVPCPPGAVSAVLECATNTAHIAWLPSEGALTYTAVATANGNSSICNTTGTNCTFAELQCGTLYSVTVVAMDETCNSLPASARDFRTAPCTPTILETFVDCNNNSAFVVWDNSDGAQVYEVTVDGSNGRTATYSTINTSALFPGLSCGETFTVFVKALDGNCSSPDSDAGVMQSAPCPPDIVMAQTDCGNDITSVSWNQSRGADSYVLTTVAGDGHIVFYETAELHYNLSDLHCGMRYNVSVMGVTLQCNSSQSLVVQVQGVPCIPQSPQVYFDCIQGTIQVSWEAAFGATGYTAAARGDVGYAAECRTSNTTCTITSLACGHTYGITVFAANNICNSVESSAVSVTTASCPLQNLNAQVECSTNVGLVSWGISNGALYYVVSSVSIYGDNRIYNPLETNTTLQNLHCGATYNVTTQAVDGICNDTTAFMQMKTVPCAPTSVRDVTQCDTSIVSVLWNPSDGAVSYNVIAKALDGSVGSCNTTGTHCDIPNLLCGHTYFVTVTGLDEKCQGKDSDPYKIQTVPCTPTNVTASMGCGESTLSVTWGAAENSVSYLVEALGSDGSNYTCTTNDTACNLLDLPCGDSFVVSVVAFFNMCRSVRSPTFLVQSGPCAPEMIDLILDCETNIVSVVWTASAGAMEYYVAAITASEQGSSCNSTGTTCALPDLQCGLTYTVSVFAHDDKCASNVTSFRDIETVPCVPENSQVQMDCLHNSAVLTWDQSRGAQSYLASVSGDSNFAHMCNTAGTECLVSDLLCGGVYSFSVAASNGICNSSSTDPVVSGLVPCPPDSVQTTIYHRAVKPQEVQVNWGESHCGVDYMATVQGAAQDNSEELFVLDSYWTTYPDFYIATPCSSAYIVTVTARNAAGLSEPSTPIAGFTAPCSPIVNPPVVSGGVIQLSWQTSLYATEYRVTDASLQTIICSTSGLSCNVPVTSNNLEITALNPSGESPPVTVSGAGSAK